MYSFPQISLQEGNAAYSYMKPTGESFYFNTHALGCFKSRAEEGARCWKCAWVWEYRWRWAQIVMGVDSPTANAPTGRWRSRLTQARMDTALQQRRVRTRRVRTPAAGDGKRRQPQTNASSEATRLHDGARTRRRRTTRRQRAQTHHSDEGADGEPTATDDGECARLARGRSSVSGRTAPCLGDWDSREDGRR